MKIKLLKIFVFFILVAVSAEAVTGIWIKAETSVVQAEKDGKEESKKGETGDEELKDKSFQQNILSGDTNDVQTIHVLSHIYYKNATYLSLPEIPPDSPDFI